MIYFDNSVDAFKNPIQPCTTVNECLDICNSYPEACEAPIDVTRLQRDGVWSREKQNNPFAEYFKVLSTSMYENTEKNMEKIQKIFSVFFSVNFSVFFSVFFSIFKYAAQTTVQ